MHKKNSFVLFILLVLTAGLIGGASGFIIFSMWDLPEIEMLEEYRPSITSRVYTDSNRMLAEFYLENRTPVEITDVPDMLTKALMAAEDSRFYQHHGLDVRGIVRAMYRNLRAHRILEGGSTLTQQLAKVLFLSPDRTFTRKFKEMALALRIEQRYTKREILSLYLNQIYFGNGAYGVEAAARIYFGKSVRDLNLAECAMLAGLPRSPNRYSPFRAPAGALARRAYVLSRMTRANIVTQLQADEAAKEPLPASPTTTVRGADSYIVEYIRQKIEERFGSSILYSGGLNIYTSINDQFQEYAKQAVKTGLQQVEARHHQRSEHLQPPLQGALIAIEPSTGHILAMVGGRDYAVSQFNRAWQAVRQPGSAFKPLIYAEAIEHGFGPSDLLDDTPLTVKLDRNKNWTPENFSRRFQGAVTLRRALTKSLNVPTVRLLDKLGIAQTVQFARNMGIRSPVAPYLSMALGSSDVTLFELTSAYAVLANHGIRIDPVAILHVTDSTGRVLFTSDSFPTQVVRPETAYIMTNLLCGVVERGTAWKARELGRPVAGKTGTANDYRDAWFIGYTPGLVAGVWVGYDDHRTIGPRETGARAALPLWLDFMKKALDGKEPEVFAAPEGIVLRQIDAITGLLSTEKCKDTIREAYVPGTEPRKYCPESAAENEEPLQVDEAPESP
jgi:penicillin-binding protein 1A